MEILIQISFHFRRTSKGQSMTDLHEYHLVHTKMEERVSECVVKFNGLLEHQGLYKPYNDDICNEQGHVIRDGNSTFTMYVKFN